jgi:hypothetical protein
MYAAFLLPPFFTSRSSTEKLINLTMPSSLPPSPSFCPTQIGGGLHARVLLAHLAGAGAGRTGVLHHPSLRVGDHLRRRRGRGKGGRGGRGGREKEREKGRDGGREGLCVYVCGKRRERGGWVGE